MSFPLSSTTFPRPTSLDDLRYCEMTDYGRKSPSPHTGRKSPLPPALVTCEGQGSPKQSRQIICPLATPSKEKSIYELFCLTRF
ncbi:MAG: hypothetical protein JSR37_03645 [Verrucomicrobia bacterium]|nr:hypothetical protein [Verrucomicrobiota bacterium]MBS0637152.1 hypothetical protein [Verrucomicrobiota bacterium]